MKTEQTKNMEYALYLSCLGNGGRTNLVKRYCATEVNVLVERKPNQFYVEIIDFVTYHNGEIRCYEIKQSLSDLKSKCALTFIGNFNYLVVPQGFYEKYKDEILKKIDKDVGVIEIVDNKLKYIKKSAFRGIEDSVRKRVTDAMITAMFYKMQRGQKY